MSYVDVHVYKSHRDFPAMRPATTRPIFVSTADEGDLIEKLRGLQVRKLYLNAYVPPAIMDYLRTRLRAPDSEIIEWSPPSSLEDPLGRYVRGV